jgi:hypothetical protein
MPGPYQENCRCRGGTCPARDPFGLGFSPAAEDEAAEREAEAERAGGERADGEDLAPEREPLPAAEHLLLLGREGLAAPLLAQRPARSQSEVEVVEDLGRLLLTHASASVAIGRGSHARRIR